MKGRVEIKHVGRLLTLLQKLLIYVLMDALSMTHYYLNILLQELASWYPLYDTSRRKNQEGAITVMAHTELKKKNGTWNTVCLDPDPWAEFSDCLWTGLVILKLPGSFASKLYMVAITDLLSFPCRGTWSLRGCCLLSCLAPSSPSHVGQPTFAASWHGLDFTGKIIMLHSQENWISQYKKIMWVETG